MAYDFGSQTLGIRNPFKAEGAVIAVRGALVTLLGLYSLLRVAGLVDKGQQIEGWLSGALGLALLVWGLAATASGLFKVFRFYVGRNVPASLAVNQADPDSKHHHAYNAAELHDMLMGRKNTTFHEPQSLFARLVHTLLPRLIFMPPTYRGLAENLMFGLGMTLFMLLIFGLAWFSGATGLTNLEGTPVMAWLGTLLALYLLKLWVSMRNPFRHFTRGAMNIGLLRISVLISLAALLPVVLVYIHHNVANIPALPINPTPALILTLVLAALSCVLGLFLLFQRMANSPDPVTEVSEHRDNWQKSIVPRELFIRLDAHILANRRYQEIPNRVYQRFEPEMIEEGGSNKGSFHGRTLVETQPIFQPIEHSSSFKAIRVIATVFGQILLAAAALSLILILDQLANAVQQPEVLALLTYPMLLLIFGLVISNSANAFWAEMQFRSMLLDLSVEGTYTESRLSTGQSIYDSTRSENIVVRSAITPWFLLSDLHTTTFARSGSMNLEQPRHIMSLAKTDASLQAVLDELDEFFASREAIAGINEVDLRSASQIFQMNEQTRAQLPKADIAASAIEAGQAAGLLRQQGEDSAEPAPAPQQ